MINSNKVIQNILGKQFKNIVKQNHSVEYLYKRDPNISIAEIMAVKYKEKPIAIIESRIKKQLNIETKLPYISTYSKDNTEHYIYYRSDTKHIAIKFKKLYEKQNKLSNKKGYSDEYHRQAGKLLGYPKKKIEEFIKHYHKIRGKK